MRFTLRQMAKLGAFIMSAKIGGPFRLRELIELFPDVKRADLAFQVSVACEELRVVLSTSHHRNTLKPTEIEGYVIDAWSSDLVWVLDLADES